MLWRSSPTYTRSASVAGDQLEDRVLQRVRVLELVDEQVPDAGLHGRPRIGVADEQIARAQLEVGEVERGRRELARGVDAVEALDEPDDLRVQRARDLAARRELHQRQLHPCRPASARRVLEPDRRRGRRASSAVAPGRNAASRSARSLFSLGVARRVVRDRELGHPRASAPRARLEVARRRRRRGEVETAREAPVAQAQRRASAAPPPPNAASRSSVAPLVALRRLRERLLERLAADDLGRRLVEHAELGVEPERERVLAQDRAAQAVDRRDGDALGALGRARPIARRARRRSASSAGRALGEGDDEDRLGIDARPRRRARPARRASSSCRCRRRPRRARRPARRRRPAGRRSARRVVMRATPGRSGGRRTRPDTRRRSGRGGRRRAGSGATALARSRPPRRRAAQNASSSR